MAKGRPKIQIDFNHLKRLCQRPMTCEDISALMGVSNDTLERAIKREYGVTFAVYKEQNLAGFRLTIIEQQVKIMNKGNASMAIWLGKQYCNQKDKTEISSNDAQPFTLAYTVNELKKVNENE